MKCAVCAVIGRPSVGKSTLVNNICETTVSITSPVPQTTRNAIKGIYTDSRGQLIFVDTPGLYLSEKSFNKRMQSVSQKVLKDCDIVLYIIDGTRPPGAEEEQILNNLKNVSCPVVCCINKKDLLSSEKLVLIKKFINKAIQIDSVLEISALKDEGVDELLICLFSFAQEGELLYDAEIRTDQNLDFRISEIIREKAINSVYAEIPHSIFVKIADLEYKSDEKKVWIRAFINVERESQKGILVGKGGENIKKIRKNAFNDIKNIFPNMNLELEIRVRVKPKWKNDIHILKQIFKETSQ